MLCLTRSHHSACVTLSSALWQCLAALRAPSCSHNLLPLCFHPCSNVEAGPLVTLTGPDGDGADINEEEEHLLEEGEDKAHAEQWTAWSAAEKEASTPSPFRRPGRRDSPFSFPGWEADCDCAVFVLSCCVMSETCF